MSNKVKVFHLAVGVDLIGSKTSMASSKNVDLEATAVGVRMYSAKSNRTIVIPYSNIKALEMMPEAPQTMDGQPEPERRKPGRPKLGA